MTPSLILGGGGWTSVSSTPWNITASKKVSWDEGSRTEAASRQQQRTSFSDWLQSKTAIWRVCGPWAARSSDLEQPIKDWQNICIIATENDLIDLSGDFEYTMYDCRIVCSQKREVLFWTTQRTLASTFALGCRSKAGIRQGSSCTLK